MVQGTQQERQQQAEGERMSQLKDIRKKVVRSGGSLCLRLTKEFEIMNVKEGDAVVISIEKVEL